MNITARFKKRRSVYFLILSNCLPIIGALFFNWNLSNLLLLYWAESGVIGFYTLLKMILASGQSATYVNHPLYKIFTTLFFINHFGGFMLGHGFFLLLFTAEIQGKDVIVPANLFSNLFPGLTD